MLLLNVHTSDMLKVKLDSLRANLLETIIFYFYIACHNYHFIPATKKDFLWIYSRREMSGVKCDPNSKGNLILFSMRISEPGLVHRIKLIDENDGSEI